MYYYFQFESNQILSHSGWYKSLIIYLTLLFDVSRVGECDADWGGGAGISGWEIWDGWSGWGWMVTVTPVNGELVGDVGEPVQWRWVSVVWVGLVVFQNVVRIQYDGFLWGNGV